MSTPAHVCTLPWWLDEYGRPCGTTTTAERASVLLADALRARLAVEIEPAGYQDHEGHDLFLVRTV